MIRAEEILGGHVLIVDDEPVNVRLLERMLISEGFTSLRCTTDSREVPSLIESFKPDLILLDLQMPHIDGFGILCHLQATTPPGEFRPVLVLTADATKETKLRALTGGAKDFVTKPFDRTEVLARVRNLLETRFLHDALQRANRALEERLVHQSLHDPLTGLANRVLFRERVEHALTRVARGDNVGVLFLDLDNFKAVNDSLGHAEGDVLLETVARRLLQATRGCDTVSRLGGDEFAILLEGLTGEPEAISVIDRVRDALSRPMNLRGRGINVSASIGLAHAELGQNVTEVLRNADLAMYHAKAAGRGGYQVYEEGMHSAVLDRLEIESDLRRALEGDEFRLLYQPIVDLESSRLLGVEALLRWQHPTRGLLGPDVFIKIAEETGLIVSIGRWALAEACRQAREWEVEAGDGSGITMSVNISGRQLVEPTLVSDVAAIVKASELTPSLLTLELTETILMRDTELTLSTLHELKSLGVRLAIDDFGTGYSSLSYLQRFPIDTLKIDKAFIDSVARGGSDAALARTIVSLAGLLELSTVAEGVEGDDQRAHLLELGCVRAQGYLFARPLVAGEVGAMMGETSAIDRLTKLGVVSTH
ncbi:MAG: putative bifunctional diguanylate cyclase/phosphodiesterase [Gemmatimonas sp.]